MGDARSRVHGEQSKHTPAGMEGVGKDLCFQVLPGGLPKFLWRMSSSGCGGEGNQPCLT